MSITNPPNDDPALKGAGVCTLTKCVTKGACGYPAVCQHSPAIPPTVATDSPAGPRINGRFAKGGPGGPGNPYAGDIGRARKEFFTSIREGDTSRITQALIREAIAGSHKHQQLYFSLIGLLVKETAKAPTNGVMSPEEARRTVAVFFGLTPDSAEAIPTDNANEPTEPEENDE